MRKLLRIPVLILIVLLFGAVGLRDSGMILLGVCRASGETFFPPPGHLVIAPGDKLFAFGNSAGVAQLSTLLERVSRTPA